MFSPTFKSLPSAETQNLPKFKQSPPDRDNSQNGWANVGFNFACLGDQLLSTSQLHMRLWETQHYNPVLKLVMWIWYSKNMYHPINSYITVEKEYIGQTTLLALQLW